MFGVLNVNKPTGMTSRAAVDRVARIVRRTKLGHAGTLDPLAHGVLLVCLGQATRLVPFLHELPKRYRATYLLGRTSPTDDTEGNVVVLPSGPRPVLEQVQQLLPRFVGTIQQTPPDYSAVKVRGRRAYDLARKGDSFALEAKTVVIHRIELVDYSYPRLVLDVTCGTGTYLRALGRDLGQQLGTGAVMSALCRTSIGAFDIESACSLDALTAETLATHLQSPLAAVAHLPHVVLTDQQVAAVRHGQQISASPATAVSGPLGLDNQVSGAPFSAGRKVAAVDTSGKLVAILESLPSQRFKPMRVFS